MKTAFRLGLGAWLIYLSLLAPSLAALDARAMLDLTLSIVQKHSIAVAPEFGERGLNGKSYSKWYPLLSVIAVPFVATGLYVARHTHLPPSYVAAVFAILLSTLIAAATVAATYYLARDRLHASERRALAAALTFGFGTPALWYSRSFYADPLLGLILTSTLIVLMDETPDSLTLALLCALAILAKPTGVLVALAAFLYLGLGRNFRVAFSSAIGAAIGGAMYGAYDWVRFGSAFATGQPNLWNLRLAPVGLAGLIFSPSVGLLVCSPVIILAVRKPVDLRSRLILAVAAEFLLCYACWQGWAASSWGPRLLLPIMPALIALSVLTKHRRLWLGLALAGALLQIPALLGSPERYDTVLAQQGLTEADTAWSIRFAPTVGMWRSAIDQARDALQNPDIREFADYHQTARTLQDSRNYRILPFWWWMLPLVHLPRVFGLCLAVLEILAGLWIIANRNASETQR